MKRLRKGSLFLFQDSLFGSVASWPAPPRSGSAGAFFLLDARLGRGFVLVSPGSVCVSGVAESVEAFGFRGAFALGDFASGLVCISAVRVAE
jgi:hypothetical protein